MWDAWSIGLRFLDCNEYKAFDGAVSKKSFAWSLQTTVPKTREDMQRLIGEGGLILLAAAAVFLFAIASHSLGSSLPSGSQKEADANSLFAKNCASCHGKDGKDKTFRAKFN